MCASALNMGRSYMSMGGDQAVQYCAAAVATALPAAAEAGSGAAAGREQTNLLCSTALPWDFPPSLHYV